MAELEKVIDGLECCEGHHVGKSCCNCPYNAYDDMDNPKQFECVEYMVRDALELLKEQQNKIKSLEQTIEDVCCG